MGDQRNLNLDSAVKYWVAAGAPKNKLVLGLASYGRSFTLSNSGSNSLGASASGPGSSGPVITD